MTWSKLAAAALACLRASVPGLELESSERAILRGRSLRERSLAEVEQERGAADQGERNSANGERSILVCFILPEMQSTLRCQLKHHVQYRLEIGGAAIPQGGLELNFFRGANRRFIQPMTEAVQYFHNANLPAR